MFLRKELFKINQSLSSKTLNEFFKNWKLILLIFIISRIVFGIIILSIPNGFKTCFNVFDMYFFNTIIKDGYIREIQTAFFPFAIFVQKFLGIPLFFLLNNGLFFISLFLLRNIIYLENNSNNILPIILYGFSPLSFLSFTGYTETIFLFLILLSAYLIKKEHFGYLLGIIIGLSVATRNVGSLWFFSVFIYMFYKFIKKQISIGKILKVYIPATIISCLYPLFLQIKFGNWKSFIDVQFKYCDKIKLSLFQILKCQYNIIFKNAYFEDFPSITQFLFKINEIITIFFVLSIISTIIIAFIKYKKEKNITAFKFMLLIYVILSFFAIYSTVRNITVSAPMVSAYRYLFALFPIYIFFDKLNLNVQKILCGLTAVFSVVVCVLFTIEWFFY